MISKKWSVLRDRGQRERDKTQVPGLLATQRAFPSHSSEDMA